MIPIGVYLQEVGINGIVLFKETGATLNPHNFLRGLKVKIAFGFYPLHLLLL
jgi:hypothetical protein